jgi:hypothetical protein
LASRFPLAADTNAVVYTILLFLTESAPIRTRYPKWGREACNNWIGKN